MGYSTTLYTVDVDALRATVGSNDAGLLARIKHAEADELDPDEYDGTPPLTLEQALEELFRGIVTEPGSGHEYAYALELICRHLGQTVAEVPRLAELRLDTPLEEDRLPIQIPTPNNFPHVSYLSAPEVVREFERLSSVDMEEGVEDALAKERQALVEALGKAKRRGLGVVCFYY